MMLSLLFIIIFEGTMQILWDYSSGENEEI